MISNTTIILPTLNEEKSISQTIKTIQRACDNHILVIDGHSTDNTTFYASAFNNVDIIYDVGKGKGAALRQAFADCYPDNVVFVDVDGTYDVHRIPEFISALDDGYDVVTGIKERYDKDAQTRIFGVGLWALGDSLWQAAFWILYGKFGIDNLTGFRALSRYAIEKMDLSEDRWGIETEITAKTIRGKFKHKTINTAYHKRIGESKLGLSVFSKSWSEIVCAMLKCRLWRPK